MSTLMLAAEFAGLAAQDILGWLGAVLTPAQARAADRLIRECCQAAILSAIVQHVRATQTEAKASK